MSLRLSLVAVLFASATAFAGDDLGGLDFERAPVSNGSDTKKAKTTVPPPVDDDEFEIEDDSMIEEEEPELGNLEEGSAPAGKPKSAMPGPITLDVAGKEPLKDNYAISVVAVDRDAVVVELPVLVARSRGTQSFQLIAEIWVGGAKVNEVRSMVSPASLAEYGPSFVFLKVLAPVTAPTGDVKIVVKQAKVDGTGAVELFSRATAYSL